MERIKAIQEIIDSRFDGNQAAFARAIDRQPSQVNQWLKGKKPVRDSLARQIEKSLNLRLGELGYDDEGVETFYQANIKSLGEARTGLKTNVEAYLSQGPRYDVVAVESRNGKDQLLYLIEVKGNHAEIIPVGDDVSEDDISEETLKAVNALIQRDLERRKRT